MPMGISLAILGKSVVEVDNFPCFEPRYAKCVAKQIIKYIPVEHRKTTIGEVYLTELVLGNYFSFFILP